jgi:hypothetical protein
MPNREPKWMAGIVLLTAVAACLANAADGGSAARRCAAEKRRAAGVALAALSACDVEAAPGAARCMAKGMLRLARKWRRAEGRGGCTTVDDASIVATLIREERDRLVVSQRSAAADARCADGKVKSAGQYGRCVLACSASAIAGAHPPAKVDRCAARCASRLRTAFGRVEAQARCALPGDVDLVRGAVDALVDCVAGLVSPAGATVCSSPTATTMGPTTTTTVPSCGVGCGTTTTTTPIGCGGLHPVCLGSCPAGEVCTGTQVAGPCSCVPPTTTSTTTDTTTSSTTTSTLLGCGGIGPVCLGSCPPGQTCSGSLLQACTCS